MPSPHPIRCNKRLYEDLDILRYCGMNSEQNDARLFERDSTLKCNLPEVLIQCQHDARLRFSEFQKDSVPPSNAISPGPKDIVALGAKRLDDWSGKIFIGKESHLSSGLVEQSGGNWIGRVFVSQVAGVGKAGENVVVRQPRIVRQDILFGLPCGKQFENELNGKATAADHRLAGQDFWIDDDTLRQRHAQILPHGAPRSYGAPGAWRLATPKCDFVSASASKFGSSGRTRTYNPSVNSRMLYH